jgi:hypothetical protein
MRDKPAALLVFFCVVSNRACNASELINYANLFLFQVRTTFGAPDPSEESAKVSKNLNSRPASVSRLFSAHIISNAAKNSVDTNARAVDVF